MSEDWKDWLTEEQRAWFDDRHPWYGPHDSFAEDGQCGECERAYGELGPRIIEMQLRSLAALHARVGAKDEVLRKVSDAWLQSANPDELWASFSDEAGGGDLWGIVAEALKEGEMLDV